MARIKKTAAEKGQELLQTIENAKIKLLELQNKQKQEIGSLAFKHGLGNYDLSLLDKSFKKLANELKNGNN